MIVSTVGLAITFITVKKHVKSGRITSFAIEEPRKFLDSGLYKYSRNPMYVGIFLVFTGLALMLGHLMLFLYPLLAIPALYLIVVYLEEPQLKQKFGKPYINYIKKVPRWLNVKYLLDNDSDVS